MSSRARISKTYESAVEIPVDDKSKIVLISDCHRGDASWTDDFADNRNLYTAALNSYNKGKFTYIEIGDGEELWKNKRFSEIFEEYKNIYALMSCFYADGRLYLLYGNHDMAKKNISGKRSPYASSEEFRRLFPGINSYEGLKLNYLGNTIFLLHGHQADFFNSVLWKLSKFLVRNIWRRLESIGVNDPTSASKNRKKKTDVEMDLINWSNDYKVMVVAGHTHRAVFPEPGESLYFNDGSCVGREYISALEIEEGNISLVSWSFKVRDDGTVYVGRDVINSSKLTDYLK